jgi:hypothetical protein
MKRMVACILALQLLLACNSGDKGSSSENEIDAARNFLNAALDGKWQEAKTFMVQDSLNVQTLETIEEKYNKLPNEKKVGYMDANLRLYESRNINDSIIIVNFSNSFTERRDSLKVVKVGGQWLIDLKYSFFRTDSSGNVQ